MYKMFVYFFKTNSVLASYIAVFIFTIQMSFYWVDKNHNKKIKTSLHINYEGVVTDKF